MSEDVLKLDHKTFRFEIIEGMIEKVKVWEESKAENVNANIPLENSTSYAQKNKREFWMKDNKGDEYYFVVNANRVALQAEQKVRLLITLGKKTEPVLVYNIKDKELSTNVTIFGLALNEAPLLNVALIIACTIGIFFALGPALISAIYTGIVLFTAMRWFTRLGFYKKRLDAIKAYYFEQDS